jgi:hypothetical protein
MEFAATSIGILALVTAAVLLSGREGTRKPLIWTVTVFSAGAVILYAGVLIYWWATTCRLPTEAKIPILEPVAFRNNPKGWS